MPGPTGRSQVSSPPSSIVARFAMSLPRPLRLLLLIVLPLLAVLIALVYSLTWRPLPHEEAAVSCSGQVAQPDGTRIGFRRDIIRPHSLPLTVLGAGILWFGWFGFNGGSAFAADAAAGNAFLTPQVAAATAATAWIIAEGFIHGKPW